MKRLIIILITLLLIFSCIKIPCWVCNTTSSTIPPLLDSVINKDYDYNYVTLYFGNYDSIDIKRIEDEGTKIRIVELPSPIKINDEIYTDLILTIKIQTTTKCYIKN